MTSEQSPKTMRPPVVSTEHVSEFIARHDERRSAAIGGGRVQLQARMPEDHWRNRLTLFCFACCQVTVTLSLD